MNGRIRSKELVDVARFREWGIRRVPWLWGERLKILFVIDGVIDTSTGAFGLGLVIDILRDPSYAWWVEFDIDIAKRGPSYPKGPHLVTYVDFRFDQSGFDIGEYDQVWLFGFNPGNDGGPDGNISMPKNSPLSDSELSVLAQWMDTGGGVFATGDHDYLGASMCSRIPRVRTMRKWTHAQGVPPIDGLTRLDTNQPATVFQASSLVYMPFDLEGDEVPQPIEVVREPLSSSLPWLSAFAPHPILCTRGGVIDVFPDHPHEGEIIDDADVELDSPLRIAGYSGVEYPGGPRRPTPHVVAYGRTTYVPTRRVKGTVSRRRFGLIGVYDGDPVGIGRIVVDSTWHHWFSGNLIGFRDSNPAVFELMKAYFRNVALWLATPAQRANMLTAATWGLVIGSGPMEFPITARTFDLGERARDVLGRTASQCTIREWVINVLDLEVFKQIKPPPDPCLSCPPWDHFEHAILGGMAKKLIEVAFPLQEEMARGGRPAPNPRAIASAASDGARQGHRELVRALADGGRLATQISRATEKGYRHRRVSIPDLGVTDVRVVIDEVRITDPNDPALDSTVLTVRFRVLIDDQIVAELDVEDVPTPDYNGPRGAVATLGRELAQVTVWRGSELAVEVVALPTTVSQAAQPLRGELVLAGDPRDWIGSHLPAAATTDQWRMKISIHIVSGRKSKRAGAPLPRPER